MTFAMVSCSSVPWKPVYSDQRLSPQTSGLWDYPCVLTDVAVLHHRKSHIYTSKVLMWVPESLQRIYKKLSEKCHCAYTDQEAVADLLGDMADRRLLMMGSCSMR